MYENPVIIKSTELISGKLIIIGQSRKR